MLQKAKILVFPFDLLSHYLRCIELSRRYISTNDVFFIDSNKFREILKRENITPLTCLQFDSTEVLKHIKKFSFSWLKEREMEAILLDQVRCIQEHKPAFVIGDFAPTLKMAAEITGTRFISVINGYMSKYYALQRPIPSPHPAAFLQHIVPKKHFEKVMVDAEKIAFRKIHKPFKILRNKYELKEQEYFLDELEGDETFICDNEKIFPQENMPESYKIIGPLLYYSEQPNTVQLNNDKKNILVTFGSSGEWKNVKCLNDEAFSMYNIITAGDKQNVLGASHITSYDFIDFNAILPQMNLVICHGGNGTLNQAYQFNVPFIAIPSIFEQEWNAARFEEVMRGKMITNRPSVKKLKELAELLMCNN